MELLHSARYAVNSVSVMFAYLVKQSGLLLGSIWLLFIALPINLNESVTERFNDMNVEFFYNSK